MNTDLTRERLTKDAERLKKQEASYERARQLLASDAYDELRLRAFDKIRKVLSQAQANIVTAAPVILGRVMEIVDATDEPISTVRDYEELKGRVERVSSQLES